MIIIGHRGAAGLQPENTIRSISAAIDLGVDGVEIDLQSVDGELIVFHDEELQRTTDGRGRLSDYSYSEIRQLDAGKGERIPNLEEVFNTLNGLAFLNIEIKTIGLSDLLGAAIERRIEAGMPADSLLISSFSRDSLLAIHQRLPDIQIGVLWGPQTGFPSSKWDWMSSKQPDWQLVDILGASSIHLTPKQVRPPVVKAAHARQMKVLVYTVNDPSLANQLEDAGVDGIFTDFPDRFLPTQPERNPL